MVDDNSTESLPYHKQYYREHRETILAQNRASRLRNREKVLARKRQYYQENREIFRAKNAAYRVAHPEEAAAYQRTLVRTPARQAARKQTSKKYYDNNREKLLASAAAYLETHPEKRQQRYAKIKAWGKAHPEKRRNSVKRHRALKRGGLSTLTDGQWETIKAHYHFTCVYCGKKPKHLTQDHIIPLSKGGAHALHNVVPACHSCNSKKGNRAPLCPVQPLLV